jgi:hypothetical protein
VEQQQVVDFILPREGVTFPLRGRGGGTAAAVAVALRAVAAVAVVVVATARKMDEVQ